MPIRNLSLSFALGATAVISGFATAGPVQIINPSGTPLTSPALGSSPYQFGVAVAADAGRIAVGAPGSLEPEGRVFIFDEMTGAFTREIVPPASAIDIDDFGTRIALDDDVLVVTNNRRDLNESEAEVYVYDAETGAFRFQLLPFGPGVEILGIIGFGTDIAVGSGVIAVSQPGFQEIANSPVGAVFLFDQLTGAPIGRIVCPDEPMTNREIAGVSIAIHGDTIAIGRSNFSAIPDTPQDVLLYDLQTLELRAQALPPTVMELDDRFGEEIALNGDTLVVCAPRDDPFGPDSGSAFVYDAATGAYRNTLALVNPTAVGSGRRVTAKINETGLIAIATPRAGSAGPAVRLFDDQTGSHVATLSVTSMTTHPFFGEAMAFVGNTLYVGNRVSQPEESDSVFAFETQSMITQQPSSFITDVENDAHDFEVAATNAFSFQWFQNGAPVVDGPFYDGAQTSLLTVNANAITQGEYVCEITSTTMSVSTSDPAYLVFQGDTGVACPGDVDENGMVNFGDLVATLFLFGPCE